MEVPWVLDPDVLSLAIADRIAAELGTDERDPAHNPLYLPNAKAFACADAAVAKLRETIRNAKSGELGYQTVNLRDLRNEYKAAMHARVKRYAQVRQAVGQILRESPAVNVAAARPPVPREAIRAFLESLDAARLAHFGTWLPNASALESALNLLSPTELRTYLVETCADYAEALQTLCCELASRDAGESAGIASGTFRYRSVVAEGPADSSDDSTGSAGETRKSVDLTEVTTRALLPTLDAFVAAQGLDRSSLFARRPAPPSAPPPATEAVATAQVFLPRESTNLAFDWIENDEEPSPETTEERLWRVQREVAELRRRLCEAESTASASSRKFNEAHDAEEGEYSTHELLLTDLSRGAKERERLRAEIEIAQEAARRTKEAEATSRNLVATLHGTEMQLAAELASLVERRHQAAAAAARAASEALAAVENLKSLEARALQVELAFQRRTLELHMHQRGGSERAPELPIGEQPNGDAMVVDAPESELVVATERDCASALEMQTEPLRENNGGPSTSCAADEEGLEVKSATSGHAHSRSSTAAESDRSSSSDMENATQAQWVDSLTTDPANVECALDEKTHAAALQPGARLSTRLPRVSRLVKVSQSYIADDEPTGATFVQMLTGAELWPVPELYTDVGVGLAADGQTCQAGLDVAPIGQKASGQAGDRFLARMNAYPLIKGTALRNRAAKWPTAGISSLVEPFLADVRPNEQMCPYETQGGTCNDAHCAFQHLSKLEVSPEDLSKRLLDCFPENDREALFGEITARAKAGATPAAILRHVTLDGGPPRLDSLVGASTRRWWTRSGDECVRALRELAGRLAEFVRPPGTTSLAAQLLVQKRAKSLPEKSVVRLAVTQMTLNDKGRLDERSDKALDVLRDAVTQNPTDVRMWHVFVDLCLLRIPLDAIQQRRALMDQALQHDRSCTPILWWKALAVERRSTPQTQLAVLRRLIDTALKGKYSLDSAHIGNALYATQRVVGAIGGPAAAIGYIRALLSAATEADVLELLSKDPLEIGLEATETTSVKYGALLRALDPRFAALLVTALAHWMTFNVALPVEGLPELGGAFPSGAPLVLLQPVAHPRVLRCIAVFEGVAKAFKRRVSSQWLSSGAYLAVAINMVRCGWLHLPDKPMEYVFRRIGDALDDGAAYLGMLQGQDSALGCDAALDAVTSDEGGGPLCILKDGEIGDMRMWHMLRTVLRHAAQCRVSQGPAAVEAWEETLASLRRAVRFNPNAPGKRTRDNWSGASCAVLYLLESLLKGAGRPWPGTLGVLGSDLQKLNPRWPTNPLVQAHIAMELAATAREPGRAPAGALLLLGNMQCYSAALPGYSFEWLFGRKTISGNRSTALGLPKASLFVALNGFGLFAHPPIVGLQVHDFFHAIARRYFEFALPFAISCDSLVQPDTPCDALSECRSSVPCAACEDAVALTPAHCEALVSDAKTAPVELVAEACERLLFGLMSHSGVLVESVDSG